MLSIPERRTREHQPGDIGARDQQQDTNGAEERPDGLARRSNDVIQKRRDDNGVADEWRGPLAIQVLGNCREVRGRFARCHAVLEAANEVQDADIGQNVGLPRLARGGQARRQRRPQLRPARVVEARRHDADDFLHLLIEPERAADDGRVAAETPDPCAVAQHHHARPVRHIVFGTQRPSKKRRRSERVEERARHARVRQLDRIAFAVEHGGPCRGANGGRARNGPTGRAKRFDVAIRQLDESFRPRGAHPPPDDEPGWFANGRGVQQDGIHGTENGRRRADGEREGDQHGRGITRRPRKVAYRQLQLADDRHVHDSARVGCSGMSEVTGCVVAGYVGADMWGQPFRVARHARLDCGRGQEA